MTVYHPTPGHPSDLDDTIEYSSLSGRYLVGDEEVIVCMSVDDRIETHVLSREEVLNALINFARLPRLFGDTGPRLTTWPRTAP